MTCKTKQKKKAKGRNGRSMSARPGIQFLCPAKPHGPRLELEGRKRLPAAGRPLVTVTHVYAIHGPWCALYLSSSRLPPPLLCSARTNKKNSPRPSPLVLLLPHRVSSTPGTRPLSVCPLPSSPPMPPPPPLLEPRDYLGAGATSSCCSSSCSSGREGAGPHLALRLGLPGSDDSPGRSADAEHAGAHVDAALTLGPAPAPAPPRGSAKRGFADSLDRSAKRDGVAADDAAGGVTRVAGAAAGAPPAAK